MKNQKSIQTAVKSINNKLTLKFNDNENEIIINATKLFKFEPVVINNDVEVDEIDELLNDLDQEFKLNSDSIVELKHIEKTIKFELKQIKNFKPVKMTKQIDDLGQTVYFVVKYKSDATTTPKTTTAKTTKSSAPKTKKEKAPKEPKVLLYVYPSADMTMADKKSFRRGQRRMISKTMTLIAEGKFDAAKKLADKIQTTQPILTDDEIKKAKANFKPQSKKTNKKAA